MSNGQPWRSPLPPEIQGAIDEPQAAALPPVPSDEPLPFFEDGALPPPPDTGAGDIDSAAPPPLDEIEFTVEEVALPPEPASDTAAPLIAASQAIEETQTDIAKLDARKTELLAEYGRSTDKKARAELEKRIAAIEAAKGARHNDLQQQRATYDEEAAVGDAQVALQGRQAEMAAKERLSAELDAMTRQEQARAAEMETARREAIEKVATAKSAVQARLQAGPQQGRAWGVMFADVLTEAINSSVERRPPNLDRVFDRYEQQNRQEWQDALAADDVGVEIAGDRVSEIARQAEQARIDAAVSKAAIAEQVERDLDLQITRAATEQQQAQLLGVRDLVRRQREAAEAQAMATSEEAYLKRQQQRAALAKTEAEIRKLQAETDKARRAGLGPGRGAGAQGVREALGVYLPGTDAKIATFGKGEEKRALDANKVVTASMDFLQTINRYQALIEDYGQRGLMESADFAKTDEFRQLESYSELAAQKLARILAGPGFAVTDSDVRNAKKLVQLPSGWWKRSDAADVATATLLNSTEDTLRNQLNPYLNTASQERLIKHARARGGSKRDALRDLEERATAIAKDPMANPKDRIAGLNVVIDRAKKRADDAGDEGNWHVDAATDLLDTYRTTLGQERTAERAKVLRATAEKLAPIRVELQRRLDASARGDLFLSPQTADRWRETVRSIDNDFAGSGLQIDDWTDAATQIRDQVDEGFGRRIDEPVF